MENKTIISLQISNSLLKKVDEIAEKDCRNRSSMLLKLISDKVSTFEKEKVN